MLRNKIERMNMSTLDKSGERSSKRPTSVQSKQIDINETLQHQHQRRSLGLLKYNCHHGVNEKKDLSTSAETLSCSQAKNTNLFKTISKMNKNKEFSGKENQANADLNGIRKIQTSRTPPESRHIEFDKRHISFVFDDNDNDIRSMHFSEESLQPFQTNIDRIEQSRVKNLHRDRIEIARELPRMPFVKSKSVTKPKLNQNMICLPHSNEYNSLRLQSLEYIRRLLDGNKINEITQPAIRSSNIRSVVRFIPLSRFDIKQGDFQIVDILEDYSTIAVLYEVGMLSDLETLDLKAHLFQFDSIFSGKVSAQKFYVRSGVQDLVKRTLNGGDGTIIIFSGDENLKPNTTSDILKGSGFDLFSNTMLNCCISVRCLGLYNNRYIDLLGPLGSRAANRKKYLENNIHSVRELLDVLSTAKRRLQTEKNLRRDAEIEPYLLFQVFIRTKDSDYIGRLSILECCDNNISAFENNCLGYESYNSYVLKLIDPFSTSKESKICFVTVASSSSTDIKTTIRALKIAMDGNLQCSKVLPKKKVFGEVSHNKDELILPRQWSTTQLFDWLIKKKFVANGRFDNSETLTGKLVMQMTKNELAFFFCDSTKDAGKRANMLYNALRRESDRIARLRVKRKFALKQNMAKDKTLSE